MEKGNASGQVFKLPIVSPIGLAYLKLLRILASPWDRSMVPVTVVTKMEMVSSPKDVSSM